MLARIRGRGDAWGDRQAERAIPRRSRLGVLGVVAATVSTLCLLRAASAGAEESAPSSDSQNVLVLIDVSRSVYDEKLPEAREAYRREPLRALRSLLGSDQKGNRVWVALFSGDIRIYDPKGDDQSGLPLRPLPAGLLPPSAALTGTQLKQAADRLRSQMVGEAGRALDAFALTSAADLERAERLLDDPVKGWRADGPTDLANAIAFAAEFAAARRYSSVHLYTDSRHSYPTPDRWPTMWRDGGWTPHFGYVVLGADGVARQLSVHPVEGKEDLVRDAALAHANERLNLLNAKDPLFAEFVLFRWDKRAWQPLPAVQRQAYEVRAFPSAPELTLTTWETGDLASGVGADRVHTEWAVPLRLTATAGPGLVGAPVDVLVDLRLEADSGLDAAGFRATPITTRLTVGAVRPNETPVPLVLEVPKIDGLTSRAVVDALLARPIRLRVTLEIDTSRLPRRPDHPEEKPVAVWANSSSLRASRIESFVTLRMVEVPNVELAAEWKAPALELPRADGAYAELEVPLRWNRPASGSGVHVQPLAPELSAWVDRYHVDAAGQTVDRWILPDDRRSGSFRLRVRGRGPHPESTPVPAEISWADGLQFRSPARISFVGAVPPGAATCRFEPGTGTAIPLREERALGRLFAQAGDVNAVDQELRLRIETTPGLAVRLVGEDGKTSLGPFTEASSVMVRLGAVGRAVSWTVLGSAELPALRGGEWRVTWEAPEPQRAILASAAWPLERRSAVTVVPPAVTLQMAPSDATSDGIPVVALGDLREDGAEVTLASSLFIQGLSARDRATVEGLGEVSLEIVRAEGLEAASFLVDGTSSSAITFARVPEVGVPVRVRVQQGYRGLVSSKRVVAQLRATASGPIVGSSKSLDFYVEGFLEPRLSPAASWGGSIGLIALLLLVAFRSRRSSPDLDVDDKINAQAVEHSPGDVGDGVQRQSAGPPAQPEGEKKPQGGTDASITDDWI